MKYLPLVLFVVVVVGLLAFSARARRRQAAANDSRRDNIRVGSEVMTTSGLYGTVVSVNDDDTVQLSIAPGIEVKWAFAALRDIESLPEQYARGVRTDVVDEVVDPSAPGGTDARVDLGKPGPDDPPGRVA